MCVVLKAKVPAKPHNTKDSSHSVYSQKTSHPLCALPQRVLLATTRISWHPMLPTHQNVTPQSGGGAVPRWTDLASTATPGQTRNQEKSVESSHPSGIFGFLLPPNPAAQLLRFAFAPATAPKPGLLRDLRAHKKALWPKTPVTLADSAPRAAVASPSLSTLPASLTKAPCQSEARHGVVAGLPIADRQLPLPSPEKNKQNTHAHVQH